MSHQLNTRNTDYYLHVTYIQYERWLEKAINKILYGIASKLKSKCFFKNIHLLNKKQIFYSFICLQKISCLTANIGESRYWDNTK